VKKLATKDKLKILGHIVDTEKVEPDKAREIFGLMGRKERNELLSKLKGNKVS